MSFGFSLLLLAQASVFTFPAPTQTARPWTYWWWPASAVDGANLTRHLESFKQAGLGGVHVIPIYGVRGQEHRAIPYLSPQWMQMLGHTTSEARRLGLGVDMTTGTGWCFGGPNISPELATTRVRVATTDPITLELRPAAEVERAAPGGAGWMLDPFSSQALTTYLARFDGAFQTFAGPLPRAFYHDSFEYEANWSRVLPDEFARRRGYRLEEHYDALFGKAGGERAARVKSDYRETLSDLLLEDFTRPWAQWAGRRGMMSRNQAHGSPGNLLDLYAAADIPETEMFNADRSTLVSKFASSAAHLKGTTLVSAETGTWIREHFNERLSDLKELIDQLFLSGVNHVVYHGSCYSPEDASWPGWLFYASTQLNSRNTLWHDLPALNAYVTRAQSLLQASRPDNDFVIYWPVHDVWHDDQGLGMNFTVHKRAWLEGQPAGRLAARLLELGYSFDFISDRQLASASGSSKGLRTTGPFYKAVVVPSTAYMPPETFAHLERLARLGVAVIFEDRLPSDVPGWASLEARRAELRQAVSRSATLFRAGEVEAELERLSIRRESLSGVAGLHFLRRTTDTGPLYFLNNRSTAPIEAWIKLAEPARAAVLMDAMTERAGLAALRPAGQGSEVFVQLAAGETLFVRALAAAAQGPAWRYRSAAGAPHSLNGDWTVTFIEGGPELPPAYRTNQLASWAAEPIESRRRFAGTARYALSFPRPSAHAGRWLLDLGDVRESARVRLNGRAVGTLIGPPWRVELPALLADTNTLEIEVTNLAANRIRDLDQRGVAWRIFYDINFVNINYKKFDASTWELRPSGLLGPVTLTPTAGLTPP